MLVALSVTPVQSLDYALISHPVKIVEMVSSEIVGATGERTPVHLDLNWFESAFADWMLESLVCLLLSEFQFT